MKNIANIFKKLTSALSRFLGGVGAFLHLPKVGIIDRYIMRKFLGTYLFAIVLIIVIVVIFDAAEKIDDFITYKAPLSEIIMDYYFNFIPYFVNQFSGLFTFIAVIFFTSKMAYQTEIIAILSSGVSFKRMMWPYMLSASIITALSLVLNLWVIPVANEHRLEFESLYFKKMRNVRYEQHIYRQITPGTFAYIRDYTEEGNSASFFAIETYEGNKLVRSLEAPKATFNPETKHWSAKEYVQRTFKDGDEEYFKGEKLDTLINLEPTELGKVDKVVQTMKIGQLREFIAQQREKGSDMIAVFQVDMHNRVTFPVATFVLTLIGVSLSSRKVRGGTGLHIGLGITLCFSFILFSRFADEFAKGGVLPAAIAVWIPNLLYLFIALYLYKKAPK